METLKFLMTSSVYPPYGIGGEANNVRDLSWELANRGHEVHIVHSIDAYTLLAKMYGLSVDRVSVRDDLKNVFVHTLKSPFGVLDAFATYSIGKSKCYHKHYTKILKELHPDVVHHHDITFLGYNFFKKEGGYISLDTAHNYWLICPNRELVRFNRVCNKPNFCSFCLLHSKRPPQVWRWSKSIENLIKELDAIITPSEFMRRKLSQKFDVKIVHIPNFVLAPPKKIKLSGYSNYFLYAGKLERIKGILDLIEVFKRYSYEIDGKLIIVGKGSLENQIKGSITKYNLQNKIIFLGFVNNEMLWSLYKDALAVVMPSIWPENNPLVALEALSVGTPVIGSDQGGIPEIVEKVDRKLIFRSGDLEGMKRVLVEYEKKRYSVEKVKAMYEKWYSVEGYINEYYRLINGL